MDQKRWNTVVTVQIGRVGKLRAISSTEEAAEFLQTRWPVDGGQAHTHARIACLAVLDGHATTEQARDAFIAAAEEAGILVRA